jgi:hypothetical protein
MEVIDAIRASAANGGALVEVASVEGGGKPRVGQQQ